MMWLWDDILSACWRPHKLAATAQRLAVMVDEIRLLAGWMAALPDEQCSTKERLCECGAPLVLILKIHLGRAPPPVPAVHTSIVLQWTISQTQPTTRWCNEYSSSWMIYWTPDFFFFLNICRLVGSSTAGLWTSSHTAFVFMCVPDLCSYAGCCWLLGLGDMRPGCDITGEERQK